MRALKILTVVMGVMIVVGTVTLVVLIAQRLSGGVSPAPVTAQLRELDEPSGTAIVGVTLSAERMAVQLRGGGPERVVLIDPRNGAIVARINLAR